MDEHPDVLGALSGEEESSDHLETCTQCRVEVEETRSVLSLLNTLPEIEPAPEVWTRIRSEIYPRRVGVLRFWLRVAAAASVAVAILSFVFIFTRPTDRLAATVSAVSPGSTTVPGTRINIGDAFHTSSFATLTLPDVGTLKLNRNTQVRFDDRRRVVLLQGELLADVIPDSGGFEVVCGSSTVSVQGTRFGVRFGEVVYVLDGKVAVAAPGVRLTLAAGEAGSLGAERLAAGASSYATWIRAMERPTVSLQVRPRGSTVIRPTDRMEWELIFASDAPCLIDDPRSDQHLLILLVKSPSGRTYSIQKDLSSSLSLQGTRDAHGRVALDVDQEAVLLCPLEPGLFEENGLHSVSVVYFARDDGIEAVESKPLTVEVCR